MVDIYQHDYQPVATPVQHFFDSTIAARPIPNQKYYAFWDKVLAGWKGR
jgi:hypothetical protein